MTDSRKPGNQETTPKRSMAAQAPQFKISVVIPCHNQGRFLGDALSSLRRQTLLPDEILICDDGSTDGSWSQIVDSDLDWCRHGFVRHTVRQGVVRTVSELISLATGNLIVRLDADDMLSHRYLERMEWAISKNDWDFAYSDYVRFGAESGKTQVPELDTSLLAIENFITASAAFRSELYEQIGGYRQIFERLGWEDYDFWMRAVERGARGGRVTGCHLEWRRHEYGSRNTMTRPRRLLARIVLMALHPRTYARPSVLAGLFQSRILSR